MKSVIQQLESIFGFCRCLSTVIHARPGCETERDVKIAWAATATVVDLEGYAVVETSFQEWRFVLLA